MTGRLAAVAWRTAVALLVALHAQGFDASAFAPEESQLTVVRGRIRQLEHELGKLQAQASDVEKEQAGLSTELALAEARVREIEIVLQSSRDQVVKIRDEVDRLSQDLEARRGALRRQLEMLALLGRPGPLQLLYDAVHGGEVEAAIGTVSVLTAAQVRLMEEYGSLQKTRTARLADLSRAYERAQTEANELIDRRRELSETRSRVQARLDELERSRRRASNRLAEMRDRAEALERLITLLASEERLTTGDDIRKFRGGLPWPVEGRVVRGFGRLRLPKYSTYTVCNGLRFDAPGRAEVKAVFPGRVAFAQHFRGYGNMVIIDHGHDVYSLVAGLASILVRSDQQVEMGTALGLAPPGTSEEGNIYFEIRAGEKAQNPRAWLQLEEGRS
jgi:septal ring factor EnvC (AmiA/AmiB activator)